MWKVAYSCKIYEKLQNMLKVAKVAKYVKSRLQLQNMWTVAKSWKICENLLKVAKYAKRR